MRFAEDIRGAFRVGLASVRANLLPMVVLWAAAVLAVLGYYHVSWVAPVLQPLHEWQDAQGWIAAFLNRFVFCGMLPGAFILTMKALAVRHPIAAILAQTLWSGICGIVIGWMYELNALWFGTGVDFWTLSVKTVVCQFVWTPFFFAPVGALVYYWIGRDFSLARCREEWSTGFWTDKFLPNLLVNWAIWIPCR